MIKFIFSHLHTLHYKKILSLHYTISTLDSKIIIITNKEPRLCGSLRSRLEVIHQLVSYQNQQQLDRLFLIRELSVALKFLAFL